MRVFDTLYDWWYFDLSGRSKVGGALVVLALVGAIAFWQFGPDPGSEREAAQIVAVTTDAETGAEATSQGESESSETTVTTQGAVATSAVVSPNRPTSTTAAPSTTTGATTTTVGTTTTTATTTGETAETTVLASEPPGTDGSPGYPTSPDGTPLPLLVIFDTDTITLSGQVPSEAARERLSALAIANSQFPDAQLVDNMVVNPAVPISVGVRVLELNSARFPAGSAEILPEHASELDRVVNIMNALPNITVLVVGHSDQRGDENVNFALSDERARAVVNYLRFLGISPTRLSSRAAGESDLLTLEDDDTALALNRRTEFVFYGLLIE